MTMGRPGAAKLGTLGVLLSGAGGAGAGGTRVTRVSGLKGRELVTRPGELSRGEEMGETIGTSTGCGCAQVIGAQRGE